MQPLQPTAGDEQRPQRLVYWVILDKEMELRDDAGTCWRWVAGSWIPAAAETTEFLLTEKLGHLPDTEED